MTSTKYIGMDVHKESISIAVMNAAGKIVMECVIETKASMILQCIDGQRKRYLRKFKPMAVERMRTREDVGELAQELGVTRRCLYTRLEKFDLLETGKGCVEH